MKIVFAKIVLVLGLITGLVISGFAAEDKSEAKDEKKENTETRNVIKTVSKEISGQVSAVSKDYIAVVYQTDQNMEYEMGIFIESVPELEHIKNFEQIETGDTVTVEYNEATEKDENDQDFTRHVAQKIIFIKKA